MISGYRSGGLLWAALRPRHIITMLVTVVLAAVLALLGATPAAADSIRDQQWYLSALGVSAAHASSQGEGVTVAVLDSGVDPNQPDLTGSVLEGVDAYASGGNGQVDPVGHGTGMAAIIAGHGHGPDNNSGILGIAPRAKILPIKLSSGAPGQAYRAETVARGIDVAVERGAKVISASIDAAPGEVLRQAVLRALNRDVVVVASVGNERLGMSLMTAPAVYPGVVAVCGTDRNGNHAPFSVPAEGLAQITVCAPAVDGINAEPGGTYTTGRSGTSMSAAIVAGVVALIRSKYPTMPNYEVMHRLAATAVDRGAPGVDPLYGYGNLNLGAALNGQVAPTTSPTPWIKGSSSPSVAPASPSISGGPSAGTPDDSAPVGVMVAALAAGLLLGGGLWIAVWRRRRGT